MNINGIIRAQYNGSSSYVTKQVDLAFQPAFIMTFLNSSHLCWAITDVTQGAGIIAPVPAAESEYYLHHDNVLM